VSQISTQNSMRFLWNFLYPNSESLAKIAPAIHKLWDNIWTSTLFYTLWWLWLTFKVNTNDCRTSANLQLLHGLQARTCSFILETCSSLTLLTVCTMCFLEKKKTKAYLNIIYHITFTNHIKSNNNYHNLWQHTRVYPKVSRLSQ
jgi:hypothetical protein